MLNNILYFALGSLLTFIVLFVIILIMTYKDMKKRTKAYIDTLNEISKDANDTDI